MLKTMALDRQDSGERLFHLERKIDDFIRYLTGDRNNPADKGALANIDAINKRLRELIDIKDHEMLVKEVQEVRNKLYKIEDSLEEKVTELRDDLQERINELEKTQIKYQVQNKIMWLCFGGTGVLIFKYLISAIFKVNI